MEENLHKDNLETFFQQNLEKQTSDASNDGWDTPDDVVWDNIKEEVSKPIVAPRRIISYTWLAAASILFLGVLFFMLNTNQRVNDISDELKKQDQELQELKKGKEDSQIVLENADEDLQTTPANLNDNSASIINQSKDELAVSDDENNSPNSTENQSFDTNKDIQNFEDENSSAQITSNTDAISKNREESLSGLGADPRAQSNGQGSGSGSVNGTDITPPPIGNNDQELLPENTAQLPVGVSGGEEAEKESVVNAQEAMLSTQGEKIRENQNLGNANIIVEQESLNRKKFTAVEFLEPAEIIVKSEELRIAKPTSPLPWNVLNQSGNKPGFYAGILAAPTLNSRQIKYPGPRPARAPFNLSENTRTSVDYGLRLGYGLNKNWSIESGINYKNIVFEASHIARIVHRPNQERRNADGNFEADYRTTLQTSFGSMQADVALTRNADTNIADNDEIELSLTTKHRLESVNIPVVAVYRNELSDKLHLALRGGFSGNILIDQNLEVLAARSDRQGVQLKNTQLGRRLQDLQKDYINWMVSAGLEFEASENMRISIEPTFTKSLSPVFNYREVKSFPTTAFVVAGVNFFF